MTLIPTNGSWPIVLSWTCPSDHKHTFVQFLYSDGTVGEKWYINNSNGNSININQSDNVTQVRVGFTNAPDTSVGTWPTPGCQVLCTNWYTVPTIAPPATYSNCVSTWASGPPSWGWNPTTSLIQLNWSGPSPAGTRYWNFLQKKYPDGTILETWYHDPGANVYFTNWPINDSVAFIRYGYTHDPDNTTTQPVVGVNTACSDWYPAYVPKGLTASREITRDIVVGSSGSSGSGSEPPVNIPSTRMIGEILREDFTTPAIRFQFFQNNTNLTLQVLVGTLDMGEVYPFDSTNNSVKGFTIGFQVSKTFIQEGIITDGVGNNAVSNTPGFKIFKGGTIKSKEVWNDVVVMCRDNQVWIWWNGLMVSPDPDACLALPYPVTATTKYFPIAPKLSSGKTGLRLFPGAVVRSISIADQETRLLGI